MLQTILSRIGWAAALLLLQVLVFNHIHLWGYATPMPYVYLLIIMPGTTPRWLYIVTGFAFGLALDIFSSTPGLTASALCLCGLFVPLLLSLFSPAETDGEAPEPSASAMKWGPFSRYALFAILLHCTAFFVVEAFTFSLWPDLLLQIASSSALTLVFVLCFERLRGSR